MLTSRVTTATALFLLLLLPVRIGSAQTSEPAASYIFPAGARAGQTVDVTIGGLFLLQDPHFELSGSGVTASKRLRTTDTLQLRGPQLTGQPSLEPDEYPREHVGTVTVDPGTSTGMRPWRVWTSQGATNARVFVIGDLPEIIEQEVEGNPLPVPVTVPVTANGRIYPRADVDIWTFDAVRGTDYSIQLCARSLLSPLDARIAVYANGMQFTDDIGTQTSDPVIRFRALHSGPHQIHVHDVGHEGGQEYIYRLTVRQELTPHCIWPLGGRRGSRLDCEVRMSPDAEDNSSQPAAVGLPADVAHGTLIERPLAIGRTITTPVRLEVSDLPEHLETEPNDAPMDAVTVAEPCILNGRIERPGDVDQWPVRVQQGQPVEVRLRARRLGSSLLPSLSIVDASGTVLAPSDDIPLNSETATADVSLNFIAQEDATLWIQVRDRFTTRGGPDFGYRLQFGAPHDGFHLSLSQDAVTAFRGGDVSLPLKVERFVGFRESITLEVEGLPQGTTLGDLVIPADQDSFDLKLMTSKSAPIGACHLRIYGTHSDGNRSLREQASRRLANSTQQIDSVLFSIAMATPFRFRNRGPYFASVHAGTVYRHPFSVERDGYDGPISVRMADRQRRHLQGIHALDDFIIPAGVTEFEFPFVLAPDMSRDQLRRCLVMGVAQVTDEQGQAHHVAFTDGEESQAPINVKAARLNVVVPQTSYFIRSDSTVNVHFMLRRDDRLKLPAQVELVVPEHVNGVNCSPVILAADQENGTLRIKLDSQPGPFNCPLTVRATILENGDPIVAETAVDIVTE